MVRSVLREIDTARTTARKSPLIRVTGAAAMATSVPVPIAMPTSARAREATRKEVHEQAVQQMPGEAQAMKGGDRKSVV